MKHGSAILALVFLCSVSASADKPDKSQGVPPGLAKKGGVPPGQARKAGLVPGLAKKGSLPPGLAKKFGRTAPAVAYIAVDPQHDDRAWFLISGVWVLRQGFDDSLRGEVRQILSAPRPPAPIHSPVPLPALNANLRVMVFGG